MLEVRWVVREYIRPSRFKAARRGRIMVASFVLFIAALLFLALSLGLRGLGSAEPIGRPAKLLAEVSISMTAAAVIFSPVLTVASILVGDVISDAVRSLPWSRVSRLRRAIRREVAEISRVVRAYRVDRLEMWGAVADGYVLIGRLSRTIGDLGPHELAEARKALTSMPIKLSNLRQRLITQRRELDKIADGLRNDLESADGLRRLDDAEIDVVRRQLAKAAMGVEDVRPVERGERES